ncbi:hypothetical protein C487_13889 [Natrinema pallidum DSM 3751]|uniref:Uncharacterized protein n=1 Tax=Natrinema pallidum DSM 3751 TaxID=1227495 RepID=L9YMN7_9EURY|nr:hypothetical protein C487_13889 [Natrinema pallidum DSM 3751]
MFRTNRLDKPRHRYPVRQFFTEIQQVAGRELSADTTLEIKRVPEAVARVPYVETELVCDRPVNG